MLWIPFVLSALAADCTDTGCVAWDSGIDGVSGATQTQNTPPQKKGCATVTGQASLAAIGLVALAATRRRPASSR